MIRTDEKQRRVEALRALAREGGAALAPMAGWTDRAFRRVCRRLGARFVVTELLSSEGLRRGGEKTARLARFDEDERPVGIQLFGHEPGSMADGARLAARLAPDFIDINFGCPARKVTRRGGGVACMREPALMDEIMRAVNEAVALPVTVKIRAGWDAEHRNAPEAARLAEAAGLALVAVHGRTRRQGFTGRADPGIIRETREAVAIPVIGNGDVVDAASYRRLMDETGVAMVLVGRAATGNPWVFAEIEAARRGEAWRPPSLAGRVELLLGNLAERIEDHGERRGVVSFRKQMGATIRGLPGAAALRRELFVLETRAAVEATLREYVRRAGENAV